MGKATPQPCTGKNLEHEPGKWKRVRWPNPAGHGETPRMRKADPPHPRPGIVLPWQIASPIRYPRSRMSSEASHGGASHTVSGDRKMKAKLVASTMLA